MRVSGVVQGGHVNGEVKFRGSTAEISHRAEAAFAWLGAIAPLQPGNVMGMGTSPARP